jgi:hypothetical protein
VNIPNTADPARLADCAAEAIRGLIYATMPGDDNLDYPSDLAAVIGGLELLAGRLPQTCRQLAGWLTGKNVAGRVRADDTSAGATAEAVTATVAWLQRAGAAAEQLRVALESAHVPAAALAYTADNEEGDQDHEHPETWSPFP